MNRMPGYRPGRVHVGLLRGRRRFQPVMAILLGWRDGGRICTDCS